MSNRGNVKRKQASWTLCLSAMVVIGCPVMLFGQTGDINYNVGAYYYPWYADNGFGVGVDKTIQSHLAPGQQPTLGWYNQNDPAVISQHYDWARYAGVDFFNVSWSGEGSVQDTVIKNNMFNNPNRGNIKLSVFMEPDITTANVYAQTTYLASNYFNQAGYQTVDSKPVVNIYLTRTFTTQYLDTFVGQMRQAASDNGYDDIYVIGDEVWGDGSYVNSTRIDALDAVTNYDVYGNIGGSNNYPYVTTSDVNQWDSWNDNWQAAADAAGVDFIPGISPGYNDQAVRSGHLPISRKLDGFEGEFGSLFEAQVISAKDNTDADNGKMMLVTSWNEWHENTQIEPVSGGVQTKFDDSPSGADYTSNLYSESYGVRYLDILREETVPEPNTLSLLAIGFLAMIRRRKQGRRMRGSAL